MRQYKIGDRVQLVHTGHLHTTVKPGDTGTVVQPGIHKIVVRFDDGTLLDIHPGMDQIEPADPPGPEDHTTGT